MSNVIARKIPIIIFALSALPILANAQSFNPQMMANNPCSAQLQAFMQATQKSGSGMPDQSAMQSAMQSTAEGQALQACLDANPSAKPTGSAPTGSARQGTFTPPTQRLTSETSATGSCPAINHNLSKDSKGADVPSLQAYLAMNSSIYPEGSVTGYFGDATTRAVQRWQKANNIVSSGSPSTTGYGAVGAKTRAALAKCGATSN